MKTTALILSLALLSSTAWAEGDKGNGGDAIVVDGKYELRDLVAGHLEPVVGNKKFLDKQAGLISLIKELSVVSNTFALDIWQDLLNADIWFTEGSLALLPSESTGLASRAAELQVAIRSGNRIIISRSALSKLHTPIEYVLLPRGTPWREQD